MIGILGERKRMDVTVISDSVNLASRLQNLNKAYGSSILISDSLYQKLFSDPGAVYNMRFLDVVQTRGKKEATCVYEVYDNNSTVSIERRNRTKSVFKKGVWLYHSEKYKDAAKNFVEVIKQDPNDRVAIFYLHRTAHFLATSYSLVPNHTDRLFEWDDKYSVGVKGIDDQHKKLFDIINDLNWAKANNVGKAEITAEILQFLIKWLQVHTTGEDRMMSLELPIQEEEEGLQ